MAELNDHKVRTHALLSASSAERWLACPPSAVAAAAYEDTGSEYAAEGTRAHEVAEMVAREGCAECIIEANGVTAEMKECAAGYAAYIDELKKSPDAVVLLEQRVDFSPWVPDGFGTCDCILIQDETLTIIDFKYGQGVPVSAVGNPQMKLYALGALNDYGIALDVQNVEMHIYQPRIDNISADKLSVSELLSWAEETVKPTAAKAAKGKGEYSPGAHCRFCPHAGRCRKLSAICTEAVNAHGLRAKIEKLAPHEIAAVLELEPLVTLWLKRVKERALSDMLSGAKVPGYKLVEGRLGNRAWVDDAAVAVALNRGGYDPKVYTETKVLSPAAMDKAIGKKKAAELVGDLVTRAPGAPTIAPESDKRPTFDPLAAAKEDFADD